MRMSYASDQAHELRKRVRDCVLYSRTEHQKAMHGRPQQCVVVHLVSILLCTSCACVCVWVWVCVRVWVWVWVWVGVGVGMGVCVCAVLLCRITLIRPSFWQYVCAPSHAQSPLLTVR